jgi:putative transposase
MGAVDFTTIEVWTRSGLVTFYILVVMRLSIRKVETAGVTPNPDAAWVQQMGRNLTDRYDGFLLDTPYVFVHRDTKFLPFRGVLEGADTRAVVLPPKNLIYLESAHRTIYARA